MAGASMAVAVVWHRWDLVILSVLFHCVVLGLFLATAALPRRRVANLPNGALAAFFIALYAEMYGLPLTLVLLQPVMPKWLSAGLYPPPLPLRFIGSAVIISGFFLVYLGWRSIHHNRGGLVRTGIYAYIRHPQYVGLLVLTLGQLMQWPTLTAAILWPFLALLYVHLSHKEDEEVVALFGEAAVRYQRSVPGFAPRFHSSPRTSPERPIGKESMGS